VQFGWRGFWVLSAILAVATLAGMTLFTWLALVLGH
jgi:nickel/cobalt exporter